MLLSFDEATARIRFCRTKDEFAVLVAEADGEILQVAVLIVERYQLSTMVVGTDLEYMCGTGLYVSPVSLPASIVLAASVPISLAALTCCDRMAVAMKFRSSLPPRGTGAQATSPAAKTSPEGWLVRSEESVRIPPSFDKTSVSRKSSELGTDPIPTTTKRAATQTCARRRPREARFVSHGVDFGSRPVD